MTCAEADGSLSVKHAARVMGVGEREVVDMAAHLELESRERPGGLCEVRPAVVSQRAVRSNGT